MQPVMARVLTPSPRVLWVVYPVVVSLVVAVVGVGGARDAAGWWCCCRWWEVMQVHVAVLGNRPFLGMRVDPVR